MHHNRYTFLTQLFVYTFGRLWLHNTFPILHLDYFLLKNVPHLLHFATLCLLYIWYTLLTQQLLHFATLSLHNCLTLATQHFLTLSHTFVYTIANQKCATMLHFAYTTVCLHYCYTFA
jgi:hypothetical protein